MYLGNSGQLLFHSEKSLEELIRVGYKFIKELMLCFTVPKKKAWNPTLLGVLFSMRIRKESDEMNHVINLPLWGSHLSCLP